MDTFADLIKMWPSTKALADDLPIDAVDPQVTIRAWRNRNNIRPVWWPDIISSAEAREIEGVDVYALLDLAVKSAKSKTAKQKLSA